MIDVDVKVIHSKEPPSKVAQVSVFVDNPMEAMVDLATFSSADHAGDMPWPPLFLLGWWQNHSEAILRHFCCFQLLLYANTLSFPSCIFYKH